MRGNGFLFLALFCACVVWGCPAGLAADSLAELQAVFDSIAYQCAKEMVAEQPDAKRRADVMLALGAYYEMRGIGEGNLLRAAEFYQMALDAGVADAGAVLGRFHALGAPGFGPPNVSLALGYYEQAVAAGSAVAMVDLGDLYANGPGGVTRDSRRALDLYLLAAARGEELAFERLKPVMQKAAEWEQANPGKKAGFPTTRREIIDPDLERRYENRTKELRLVVEETRRELDRRISSDFAKAVPRKSGDR